MKRIRQIILKDLSKSTQQILYEGQKETAKVWNYCVDQLQGFFKGKRDFPSRNKLQIETKNKYNLHSQSIQMVCRGLEACFKQTRANKVKDKKRRYPHKEKKFRTIEWPAQAMSIHNNTVVLPMGRGRKSIVLKKPDWLTEKSNSKILWNGQGYEWHIIHEQPNEEKINQNSNHATVDLGQIHLGSVLVNNGQGMILSGRGIRSEKRHLNKIHGKLQRRISKCKKGSRKFYKLVKAKRKASCKLKRKIRDMRHKATRKIVDFCNQNNVSEIFVGNPSGVQHKKCGKKHNQRMSQWEFGKDIQYIFQKSEAYNIRCSKGSERGTSSTCPVCHTRKKATNRNWVCKSCDFKGHRDIVGAMNMHQMYFEQKVMYPTRITYLRPDQQWEGSSRRLGT